MVILIKNYKECMLLEDKVIKEIIKRSQKAIADKKQMKLKKYITPLE
jgi:hypothetical protein